MSGQKYVFHKTYQKSENRFFDFRSFWSRFRCFLPAPGGAKTSQNACVTNYSPGPGKRLQTPPICVLSGLLALWHSEKKHFVLYVTDDVPGVVLEPCGCGPNTRGCRHADFTRPGTGNGSKRLPLASCVDYGHSGVQKNISWPMLAWGRAGPGQGLSKYSKTQKCRIYSPGPGKRVQMLPDCIP